MHKKNTYVNWYMAIRNDPKIIYQSESNYVTIERRHSQSVEPSRCNHSDSHHFHLCPAIIVQTRNKNEIAIRSREWRIALSNHYA